LTASCQAAGRLAASAEDAGDWDQLGEGISTTVLAVLLQPSEGHWCVGLLAMAPDGLPGQWLGVLGQSCSRSHGADALSQHNLQDGRSQGSSNNCSNTLCDGLWPLCCGGSAGLDGTPAAQVSAVQGPSGRKSLGPGEVLVCAGLTDTHVQRPPAGPPSSWTSPLDAVLMSQATTVTRGVQEVVHTTTCCACQGCVLHTAAANSGLFTRTGRQVVGRIGAPAAAVAASIAAISPAGGGHSGGDMLWEVWQLQPAAVRAAVSSAYCGRVSCLSQ
jgi:hypothetical protein